MNKISEFFVEVRYGAKDSVGDKHFSFPDRESADIFAEKIGKAYPNDIFLPLQGKMFKLETKNISSIVVKSEIKKEKKDAAED